MWRWGEERERKEGAGCEWVVTGGMGVVQVDGSFLVQARDPLGETVGAQDGHPRLHYGQK